MLADATVEEESAIKEYEKITQENQVTKAQGGRHQVQDFREGEPREAGQRADERHRGRADRARCRLGLLREAQAGLHREADDLRGAQGAPRGRDRGLEGSPRDSRRRNRHGFPRGAYRSSSCVSAVARRFGRRRR